ncbi:MAG: 2-C-methyl-D-erythritol 2,4-cyclodiphosphate synthase, partial [Clostridia bacterium]|nr:2-C-methyl-D-erythritol 2,4-cyclodiphosphate synthase [Clostridia bacterium]
VEQYSACIESVKSYGSGVVAMPATDTTAVAENGYVKHIPARSTVFTVQTPQGFLTKDIKAAYEKAIFDGGEYTDDGSVYSRYVTPARICECGTADNKKLTFKEDFSAIERSAVRMIKTCGCLVGFGVDVHAFGKKRNYVTLCGVKVPCDEGLIAHSDGDVAVHAVIDALLSAAGLRDIGYYFPDTDKRYLNADSGELLEKVIALIADKGFKADGLSIAIQAEKPRLSLYVDGMISRLEELTGVPRERIAIAAGTCEGLGFVGEKRGVCAYCVAVLKKIGN